MFAHEVIAPYDAEDSRGLLKAAIRDPDPVVFLENEILYGQKFSVSSEMMDHDFTLPLDKAKVMREGTDVTLIGFGKMVGYNIQAADLLAQEGVSCEVCKHLLFRTAIISCSRSSICDPFVHLIERRLLHLSGKRIEQSQSKKDGQHVGLEQRSARK